MTEGVQHIFHCHSDPVKATAHGWAPSVPDTNEEPRKREHHAPLSRPAGRLLGGHGMWPRQVVVTDRCVFICRTHERQATTAWIPSSSYRVDGGFVVVGFAARGRRTAQR